MSWPDRLLVVVVLAVTFGPLIRWAARAPQRHRAEAASYEPARAARAALAAPVTRPQRPVTAEEFAATVREDAA